MEYVAEQGIGPGAALYRYPGREVVALFVCAVVAGRVAKMLNREAPE